MNAKVLIVDDEKSVRHMLRRMLEASSFDVLEAEDGQKGVEVDKKNLPDLVLTDLKMPHIDGLEMAQILIQNNPDRPVLMMTAYADVESARKALKIGIYEYFLKPVDMNDILAGISRALEHRRLVFENRTYQKNLEKKVALRTRALRKKVGDLEARDVLLRQLLSIQEPEATLGMAVKLTSGLCDAQFGALYTADSGEFCLRAAFGFGAPHIVEAEELNLLGLEEVTLTQKLIHAVIERQEGVVLPQTDAVRKGFGMGSLGMLPVFKGDDLVAFMEVGKSLDNLPLKGKDLRRAIDFLPYVAMAVDDCILQESIPEWAGRVESLLDETDKWVS